MLLSFWKQWPLEQGALHKTRSQNSKETLQVVDAQGGLAAILFINVLGIACCAVSSPALQC